jgi:tRNA uridine 5-carboxymethylaminomethyl modification enzyme
MQPILGAARKQTVGFVYPFGHQIVDHNAEYRLHLRWDNADVRLLDHGRRLGLISESSVHEFDRYRSDLGQLMTETERLGSPMEPLGVEDWDPFSTFEIEKGPWSSRQVEYQAWVQHKYSGYLNRQASEIARFRSLESKRIPDDFDFSKTPGLLLESREKLNRVRPRSLGQASRISGVTPADLSILMIFLKRHTLEPAA